MINNQTRDGYPQYQVRQFEIALSADGANFDVVLTGELGSLVHDYWFALDRPVSASFARLTILSTYADQPTSPSYVSLGEWSVIAEPGFVLDDTGPFNIADWALGGFVSRADPQQFSPDPWISMLTRDDLIQYAPDADTPSISWDVSFAETRAAQVTEMQWIPSVNGNPDYQIAAIDVSISMGTPSGPWTPIGTWDLTVSSDGTIEPFQFDDGTWARYIRFTGMVRADQWSIELPEQLMVFEAETSDAYRSITGAWGSTNRAGPWEWLNPPDVATFSDDNDAPDDRALAAEIDLGETINGMAQIGADVDWYRVRAADGDNSLTFTLSGNPTVDVIVRVYDEYGGEIPVTRELVGSAATVRYTAAADPGVDYLIRVEQPPHSIVFTFDTSFSMGAYMPMVHQSLRSFADGVEPGQEFVQVMAFDEDPLLEDFTDDSYLVYSAINGYYDQSLSSSGETGILDATELLAGEEGTTAILIITDAETGSYGESAKMWAALDVTQPRVFAVHVAGAATPVLNEHLMQNWSSLGGYYQYTTNQAEMDRAFDRAATWLRRPTSYSLTVESSFIEPETPTPEPTATEEPVLAPGTLAVVAADSGDDEGSAAQVSDAVTIEIILDTSGSMLAGMPDGQRRIDVARRVLTDLVMTELPAGVPVSLRVFGNTPDSCDTSLLVPVSPLDPAAMATTIQSIEPVNLVKTPLGASLEQVANDLAGVSGPKIVVLVTDGEETCDGDPAMAIQNLAAQGVDVQINIVGFALDDDALRAQFDEWARLGNGTYFDATNSEELDTAIANAVSAPYQVLDANGNEVAVGTVNGNPVELPPGTYTVVVLTDPEQRFEDVVVEQGGSMELQISP
jgi:peptidyl-tRNA hydrolase